MTPLQRPNQEHPQRWLQLGSRREEELSSYLVIESDEDHFWRWIVDDVGAMVQQLLRQPTVDIAEHEGIPAGPGVYLVPCGPEDGLVVLVANLRRQLLAAVDPEGEGGSTYLSFHLARLKASQAGIDIDLEREPLEADPAFRHIYAQTKAEVPRLLVRYLTLEDLMRGQVLALYSEALRHATAQRGGI